VQREEDEQDRTRLSLARTYPNAIDMAAFRVAVKLKCVPSENDYKRIPPNPRHDDRRLAVGIYCSDEMVQPCHAASDATVGDRQR
jgi:hypothetical protein